MNETKYGIISDIHSDPRLIIPAITVLKNLDIDKLILNGDIANQQSNLEESRNHVAFVLNAVGESGLETYVQPGSHETVGMYAPVIDYFADKYSNLIDVISNPKVDFVGHSLAFLPGSDWVAGGEYHINNGKKSTLEGFKDIQTGLHFIDPENPLDAIPTENFKTYVDEIVKRQTHLMPQHYFNMNDLRKTVTSPDKTIVVCHVPRKFDNPNTCVDMAEFGIVEIETIDSWTVEYKDGQKGTLMTHNLTGSDLRNYFTNQNVAKILGGDTIHDGTVFPAQVAQQILQAFPHLPIDLKKENRGNVDLKNLYEEIGINKAVSGHFHESVQRAHDSKGNTIKPNTYVNELFWNASHLDTGLVGIMSVKDAKVSYQNINLRDYLSK